jgi:hypothetical protein
MAAAKPDSTQVMSAIEIYLKLAYPDHPPPVTVRSLVSTLKSWGGNFFEAPVFATDAHEPPTRSSMRLGNGFYPHMKLVFQLSPNDEQFLFRVDTHDKHCCPPSSAPEYTAFCDLMERNQRQAEEIESAWAEAGIATFKTYLREDLAKRKATRI